MRIQKKSIYLILLTAFIFTGCAVNFAGKTPTTSSDVRFITGNEDISKNNYDVKGVVVVQRQNYYFDLFGLIKPSNDALSDVFTDDIANELTQKVRELGGNAVLDMEVEFFCPSWWVFIFIAHRYCNSDNAGNCYKYKITIL